MDEPLVSIVIPVKNGEAWLDETIPAMLNQQVNNSFEIIVIDSGSSDRTLNLLSKYPVQVVHIKAEDFNHGLTRNMGVDLAKGKYIVMTVQDAKPASRFWLQELLNGFIDDSIVAVCGQQIVPHDLDKNPVDWYRPISKPVKRKYCFINKESFLKLSPGEQLSICRWDNVNAMYKKDILIRVPFREVDFAEDALWARDALMNGYCIVYNPLSQVEHYHFENYEFAFKRNFIIQYHFYKYFGVEPAKRPASLIRYIRYLKTLFKETGIPVAKKLRWLKYNYRIQKAVERSNRVLLTALRSNQSEKLTRLYNNICTSVPQALKYETSNG